jgi:ABC-type sugar transport system ATPase subunit
VSAVSGETGPPPATGPSPAAGPAGQAEDQTPVLSVRHMVKRFGAVTAIDDVTLDIYRNEVLGIVGDNGAGKSTFLSLLSGYHHPDAGEFRYRGSPVRITSPNRSRRELGIEMVYQDLAMAQDLTVWQNLFLGEERRRWRVLLDRSAMRAQAREALQRMQTKIGPDDLVSELSGGERQIVAMARGVLFDRDIVLLDEPTSAVSVTKADDVLDTIRDLHANGKTVILISHRVEDVLAVCTRIAVFVTGRIAHVVPNDGLTAGDLIHLMFGERAARAG